MTGSDERLAPVTYLPGVRPPSEPVATPSAEGTVAEGTVAESAVDGGEAAGGEFAEHEFAESAPAGGDRARRRAENVSLHALTRRGLSRREVERTLRDRELDDETIAAELDRLEGVGLVDDLALAQDLVSRLQERKGLGRQAIAAELTRRLLAPAAIEYALELVDGSDELVRAQELAVKRASQLRGLDRDTAVRRLHGYLARRGYSGSTARSAIEHALPAHPAGRGVRFR